MNDSKIYAGISAACGYPEHPEITVKNLCERGVKNLELFVNTHSETEPEYIRGIAAISRANCAR